jgi:hypothetical protein
MRYPTRAYQNDHRRRRQAGLTAPFTTEKNPCAGHSISEHREELFALAARRVRAAVGFGLPPALEFSAARSSEDVCQNLTEATHQPIRHGGLKRL